MSERTARRPSPSPACPLSLPAAGWPEADAPDYVLQQAAK